MAASQQPIIVNSGSSGGKLLAGLAVVGVGVFAYYKVAKPLIDKLKANSDLNKQQGATITTGIYTDPKTGKKVESKKLYDISGRPITSANLYTIASDIYAGLHPGWYKPTNQERVIRAFMNTPYGRVGELEKAYLDKYSENLRDTMVDKLSDANWIKVKNYFK